MNTNTTWINGVDDLPLYTYVWSPQGDAKAVITLIHGQAERAGRYARFAEALTAQGYAVVAADLRGHGKTMQLDRPKSEWGIPGHMADEDGWNKAVRDNALVAEYAAKKFPGVPRLLFGHSLGSAISQNLVIFRPDLFDAMMLSGCWGGLSPELTAMRFLVWIQNWVLGPRAEGAWIDAITFKQFLEPFQPIRNDAEWLSRDLEETEKFVNDPLVGQNASCRHWVDFANAFEFINQISNLRQIDKSMAISFWGGGQDTVSKFGKDFERLKANYDRAGLSYDAFFFEQCRHELLNELERDEITAQMIAWFDGVLAKA